MADLTIIIPVYNEEPVIRDTLSRLGALSADYDLIVVDDYSLDDTGKIVGDFISGSPRSKLLKNRHNKGFGNALKTGFENTPPEGITAVVMADLCDEIELIPAMCAKLSEGYDVVCASRYSAGGSRNGGPVLKGLFSRALNRIIRRITKIPTCDVTNSFKAYSNRVLRGIFVESNGFDISMEITLKAYFQGFRIAELPTKWKERARGESHFSVVNDGPGFLKWFFWAVARKARKERMSKKTGNLNNHGKTKSGFGRLRAFFWQNRLWWIMPMLLVLVLLAVFILFTRDSAVVPFIYTLF